ncbi:unnamed protein product [Phytophthora lilii]|uniref:Unnamed protein product n=1 Tax=Phytophthora lilii TaxID=2077276 RepID=A0A9W6UEN5_9STRA|nr:unnamed protein product [Phytophthora lilii]
MSTMGIPLLIVMNYVNQYNVVLTGFGFDLLGDDEWVAQMLNKAQMVLILSWSDLATRFFFSVGLVFTTISMKELLRYAPRHRNRVANKPTSGPLGLAMNSPLVLSPTQARYYMQNLIQLSVYKDKPKPKRRIKARVGSRLLHWIHCLFAGSGVRDEVEIAWDKFDPNTAMRLQILHCPTAEIPRNFQNFHRLTEIRVYNSTIVEWGADAAITVFTSSRTDDGDHGSSKHDRWFASSWLSVT